MTKMVEGNRWSWESPIPPMFGEHSAKLHPSLMPHVLAYRSLAIILSACGIGFFFLIFWVLDKGFASIVIWWFASAFMTGAASILLMDVIEKRVAKHREPSPSIVNALVTICGLSEDVRKSVEHFEAAEMLSFAVGRSIVLGNQHLLMQANSILNAKLSGPGPMCDLTCGENLIFEYFGGKLIFFPCIDGWYRARVDDTDLHRMLCANAAGVDAGRYWMISHTRGVWGVPSSFTEQLPMRLSLLSRMMPSSEARESDAPDEQ